jgi:hypothetical protein
MIYIFLTALAISGLDVFMSSWKAMGIGACALAALHVFTVLRVEPLRASRNETLDS